MKKLLVFFLSGILVFSLAAAALAEVTVNGDFRYDMYDDESKGDDDNTYGVTDLRIRFTGDLSDTVKTSANLKWVQDTNNSGDTVTTSLDEFYVIGKESWGAWKTGHYEYKFTPSRVELKSGHYHVWEKTDTLFEVNIPVAEGFTVDAMVQPYAENAQDDGAWGVAVNYTAEKWGAKVTYADFLLESSDYAGSDKNEIMACDVYYKINDDMTVYVAAVDFSANDQSYYTGGDTTFYDKYGIDGIDPVIGFKWNNVVGIPNWFASAEYAINKRYEDLSNEYTEYFLKTTYKFSNGVGLEIFYCPVGDDQDKTQVRLRYQF
jgi:hypothetical protein